MTTYIYYGYLVQVKDLLQYNKDLTDLFDSPDYLFKVLANTSEMRIGECSVNFNITSIYICCRTGSKEIAKLIVTH